MKILPKHSLLVSCARLAGSWSTGDGAPLLLPQAASYVQSQKSPKAAICVEEHVYIHRVLRFMALEKGQGWGMEVKFFLHLNSK